MQLPNAAAQLPQTPFYLYDTELLDRTLQAIKAETAKHNNYHVHYAVKANANPEILRIIAKAGFGADCVSGGEIQAALDAGFAPESIVYAGVGKADWEIELALKAGIAMFNVESNAELDVINEIALKMGRKAYVSFRINPEVGAHTHAHITTGTAENKFGIAMKDMLTAVRTAQSMQGVECTGLHFHIGSQILDMKDFKALAIRINVLQAELEEAGFNLKNINVGGGLGIDYEHPNENPIPDFDAYFKTYADNLVLRPGQQLHFELGRAVVGQMGALITRILYVKETTRKRFAIVDAGMTDLIRPALYGALHYIQPLNTEPRATEVYDVVGPICESSDTFAKDYTLPVVQRGDYLALCSAGAYGEIMASSYNCRRLPKAYTLDSLT